MSTSTELATWLDTAREVESADVKVPPQLIRSMLMQSVVVNWPRYETLHSLDGEPVVLRFGSPSAANKALEMLAKDSGMLDDHMDVSGSIEVKIVGVDVEDLK
jgi:hypothetical protein